MTVFGFGSINIDHIYRVAHLVRPGETIASRSLDTVLGGKGANQSVALARAGASVRHVGRIGRADEALLETLDEAGVDTSLVERPDITSGHAIIQVDDTGENAIVLHGGANHGFDRETLERLLEDAVAGDWLLMQNECDGLHDAFAIAIERGLRIAFNPAPMTAAVASLPLEAVSLLVLNETEAEALGSSLGFDPSRPQADRWPNTTVALTLGGRGARLLARGREVELAAPDVEVVDTTGAGDTFTGFLLAALIDGSEPREALARSVAAGALAVTREGATPSIPDAAAVDAFLAALDD